MTFLLDFFKAIGVRGVVIIILSAALTAMSISSSFKSKEITRLEGDLKTETFKVESLGATLKLQNDAVDKLKEDSDKADEATAKAVADAKKEAQKQTDLAIAVLKRKPVGTDDCKNTEDLFNEAIRNAKGQAK